jgi:hypothetical protein
LNCALINKDNEFLIPQSAIVISILAPNTSKGFTIAGQWLRDCTSHGMTVADCVLHNLVNDGLRGLRCSCFFRKEWTVDSRRFITIADLSPAPL